MKKVDLIKYIKFKIILTGLLVYLWLSISCQEFSYRHYSVRDGLVQNQVTNIFQDSKGYLWLATKGGVSRFDGIEFRNYTVNDGLLSNQIVGFFEDAGGGIYFSSLMGLSRLHNGNITSIFLNDTIGPKENLIKISGIDDSYLCVLNYNKISLHIETYDSSLFRILSRLRNYQIGSIIRENENKEYWVKCQDDDLLFISEESITFIRENITGYLVKDKSGKIYTYDQKNVYQVNSNKNELNILCNYTDNDLIGRLDFDSKNNIYFSSGLEKINVFNGREIITEKKKFNYINKLLIDTDDNLWIGTETGLYRKIGDAFQNFTTETGANEYVWSIVEDKQKNIWFASYGDGLVKWDGEKFDRINNYKKNLDPNVRDYFYTSALKATDQNLYFPIKYYGVVRYNGKDFSIIEGLPRRSALDIYDDTLNNRFLVASTGGLIVLEDYTQPILHTRDFNLYKNHIKTIAQDKFGRYWLGGDYTLNIYDGNEFIGFPNDQYDYDRGAISIYKDHHENLWLGTTAGLYFFDYNGFKRIGSGLLDSQVSSFVERDTAYLFMGVGQGLAMLNLELFYRDSTVDIKILDESRGFLGFDCIRNGILLDSDKNIWVAASDRVVKFYPDKLEIDTISPKIIIQELVASGSKHEETMSILSDGQANDPISLYYFQKNIRVDFHAVHFIAPEKITYSYKLTGYDDQWSDPSPGRLASYTNLEPGKYTFEVKAKNIDGLWSSIPAKVSFEIIPAYWQTLTFRMIANLVILIIILSVVYFWLQRRRKKQLKIQETERRISELQLKTIRSQMDPHFTFNALNTISSFIYKENKEKAYRYFTKFSKLIRSALEVSDKISRTLEEEIEFTENYLDLEKIRFKDIFQYRIELDECVDKQMIVPKMIIQNYAENAVKHGLKHLENDRNLFIAIKHEHHHVTIIVEDNGVGREKAVKLNPLSTGKGLSIMNNIYDLYNKLYHVKIEQEIEDLYDAEGNPAGTRVIVRIPVKDSEGSSG